MEKKQYLMPDVEVYVIKSDEICDLGMKNSADDSPVLGKDTDWEDEDWEDEDY